MKRALAPLSRAWEDFILSWAQRELPPTHPVVPNIALRLADRANAPSPMHPHDSIVTGACILASLFLLAMSSFGLLPGGGH